jgi:hypothetical protein
MSAHSGLSGGLGVTPDDVSAYAPSILSELDPMGVAFDGDSIGHEEFSRMGTPTMYDGFGVPIAVPGSEKKPHHSHSHSLSYATRRSQRHLSTAGWRPSGETERYTITHEGPYTVNIHMDHGNVPNLDADDDDNSTNDHH